jgi:hypothetical protein
MSFSVRLICLRGSVCSKTRKAAPFPIGATHHAFFLLANIDLPRPDMPRGGYLFVAKVPGKQHHSPSGLSPEFAFKSWKSDFFLNL